MPTATAVTSRSRHRVWTYADYCRIPPDRKRHEIIDGRHYVSPAPDLGHQDASANLHFELMAKVKQAGHGKVYAAPIDVHLGRGSLVQPDLVVVLRKNAAVLGDKKITGAPDLVVEILSPSTTGRDRRLKKARYERAGVREFWIVDTDEQTVEQFVLRGGRYGRGVVCTDRIRLRILRGVTIDLGNVW
ncbi:MAG: Uma2 family endonuclease [Planctomycetota bacterium]